MEEKKPTAEDFFEKEEKRETKRKILKILLIPLYYIIYIPLFVMCWRADDIDFKLQLFMAFLLFSPVMYYLYQFKSELMFEISYLFKPEVKDPEPSDWYYISSALFSYLFLLIGPVISVCALLFP